MKALIVSLFTGYMVFMALWVSAEGVQAINHGRAMMIAADHVADIINK